MKETRVDGVVSLPPGGPPESHPGHGHQHCPQWWPHSLTPGPSWSLGDDSFPFKSGVPGLDSSWAPLTAPAQSLAVDTASTWEELKWGTPDSLASHMRTRTLTHTRAHTHTHTHTHARAFTCTLTRACMHTHTHAHTWTRAHTRTRTHAHAHTLRGHRTEIPARTEISFHPTLSALGHHFLAVRNLLSK